MCDSYSGNCQRGRLAQILAGHDKGGYCVVLGEEEKFLLIADGRRRMLEAPKRKNPRHLQLTSTVLEEGALRSDKALRKALHPYQFRTGDLL